MSRRHRHFSVLPACLANITGGADEARPSQDGHVGEVAGRGTTCQFGSSVRRAQFRSRRRLWIVDAGHVPATVPMWTSRTGWLSDVAAWCSSVAGAEVRRRHHLSSGLVARVAAARAQFADGATGRHCAAANARIAEHAGCSERSVTAVSKVLAEVGLAVEVRRGTWYSSSPAHLRRPSVWHLVSRRPVDNRRICDLPRPVRDTGSVPVRFTPPSGALSAPLKEKSPKTSRRRRLRRDGSPRQLHVQQLAGWLASNAVGLGPRPGQHVVGQLCDALTSSHLDLPAWSGQELVRALNRDMHERGWTWPNEIAYPGRFLAYRLRYLPTKPPAPVPPVSSVDAASSADTRPLPGPASPARRAAQAAIRAILARRRS